jgi:hypothetical protein
MATDAWGYANVPDWTTRTKLILTALFLTVIVGLVIGAMLSGGFDTRYVNAGPSPECYKNPPEGGCR